MHRNLNISSEDGTRRQKYERMAQMNQPAQKTEYDKENTHYTYSPTTVSPKKTLDFDTQANSPRFTHNQDSFEESANVSHTNYTEQYHSKRLSELRETSSNRRNILQNGSYGGNNDTFEKSRNYTENDVKLLKQEAIALRRSLGEAQAKTSIMSKEFSKLQHENSMYQSQLKRSEMKIKELIESHSTDQAKISELTLQRSQLHADLAKMRTELYDNSKTKENVENLKKSLLDVENLIEYKNKRLFKQMKQLNFGLGSLQGIMSSSDSPRSEHCQHLFEKLQEIMGNILNISGCTDIEELNSLQESNGFNTMAKFREAMSEYEHENTELKDHIIYLDNLLQKEELKNKENKELLPQYRESIEKLRKNVHKIKDQLKETQQQRKEEKRQYLERLQEIEDINKELVEDNETLKGVNKELIEENETLKAVNEELVDKAKDNEMLILQNEEKLKKLMKDYKKLETSIKSVQKNQASASAYSSVNMKRPTYEDNSAQNFQKDPRSRSRDHHTLNRTFTEGEDNLPKNVVPRSSSVARSRRETSSSNRRDVRGYQRQNTTDTATDQMSYGCQTVSSRRVRDLNSLNRTFEADDRSHQTEDRNNYLQAPPTGKFRGNYDSAPPCYIEDNSIIEEKDSRDVALEENYYSGQVNRSYTRQPRNTSNYERAPKDLSLTTSFNGDLKHEIASLDNEIGEIQRFMEDNLDLDDTN